MTLTVITFKLIYYIPIVILESSSNQTCPGDKVTYTCVTDTGELVWDVNHKAQLRFSIGYHQSQQLGIFTVNLTNISGMVIVSTATISNVLLEHNGTVLSCSDNATPQLADEIIKTVIILGKILVIHWYIQKKEKKTTYTFMFFM